MASTSPAERTYTVTPSRANFMILTFTSIIGLIALMACNGFLLPYQSTTYLALYHGTNGRLFSHGQARPMAVAYGVVTLVALCASVPLWRLAHLL